ncbi:Eco57I restriction-modification methylase domain-containing protein [Weissella confusa]|uniref:Eco57I restriction-modification methylase domain-containing protein n=1 Tax=Weissella confusa TaxID=1583 RepID=UPI0021AEA82B|nr:Eco57I restriction-modification methylase domain-containing protein [Weissella confusa]
MDIFYDLKRYGNEAAHSLDKLDKAEGLKGLSQMLKILLWFTNKYTDQNLGNRVFFEPQKESVYKTAERKLIYVHQVDNSSGKLPLYDGLEKVGEASTPADDLEADWTPNSDFLREIADKRINQYMETAGLPHNTQWAELGYRKSDKTWFHDYDVHEVLQRSGVKKSVVTNGNEWYETDVDTVRKAIAAVKAGQSAIDVPAPAEPKEIVLRPEQNAAVAQTKKVFAKKSGRKMLWNAKMRFGKTLTALQLIKDEQFEKVLIMTHRPVVSDSWFDDFRKMKMTAAGYERGAKTTGKRLPELLNLGKPFVYFASIQDLRGSELVGGKAGDKNRDLFETGWDLVIIDEAHEGTQTELAENVLKAVVKDNTKTLELSGTPFNLLDQYEDDNVYTWDYVMEQQAKQRWENEHPGEPNPYESLPKVSMYTFEMKNKEAYSDVSKSFNFKEFFKVNEDGKFVHEADVDSFLDEITKPDSKTNYPFSTQEYREELRHTLWLMPGVKEATALEARLNAHKVFGSGEFKIVNVVADGKEDNASESDLQKVRDAITNEPSETKTITLTVRKLTTGVNVREWTAVMFLSNTNSAMQYLQAAFRAQTPFSDEKLGMKTNSYIFDFAPDRALTVMAESSNLGSRPGKRISGEQKDDMRRLLNFMPIIGATGNGMKPFSVDSLLTKIKRVYAEKAVRSGFEDDSLYSDELLLNLDNADLDAFNKLKAIVGTTEAQKKPLKVKVNDEGFTEEEYDDAERAKKKKPRERTPEEKAALEKLNERKKQKKTLISILRGISIRIPMMIYGMDIDIEDDGDIDTFIRNVDDMSWDEFMPVGVTKGMFKDFTRYYDSSVFIEAGRIIRREVQELDKLDPLTRAEELALIFGTFKNPDKETVLTPWRAVNIQLGKTLGGMSFFDKDYIETTIDGVGARHWLSTEYTHETFGADTKTLEINSKTGLYPLYAATSYYSVQFEKLNEAQGGKFTQDDEFTVWQNVLKNNVFVVAKTPMAATITKRTLAGYNDDIELNIKFVDGIVEAAKNDTRKGVELIEKAFNDMKFDVVIGNPPYQETLAGDNDSYARPIYNLFMDMAYQVASKAVLITPARFLFNAGSTPSAWNEKMLNNDHLKVVYYEAKSANVFPNTDIKGGVAVTLYDATRSFGKIGTFTAYPELTGIANKAAPTDEADSLASVIYIQNKFDLDALYADHPEYKAVVGSNGADKRFRNNIFDKIDAFKENKQHEDDIPVIGVIKNKRVWRYLPEKYFDMTHENIHKYKVLVPRSNGSGALGEVLSTPLIGYTQTFIGIGAFETRSEAEAAFKYVKSKFARTMLGILKVTQDNNRDTWVKVPLQDFTVASDIDWTESIPEIDRQLYAKYDLTNEEISFIESNVREME